MKQICYMSYLSDGFDIDETIQSIKNVATAKNRKYGITGRLIHSKSLFIQFLEGEDINVDITYRIIQSDERNHENQLLFTQESSERFYPEWDMNFDYKEKIDLATINKILQLAEKMRSKKYFPKEDIENIFNSILIDS